MFAIGLSPIAHLEELKPFGVGFWLMKIGAVGLRGVVASFFAATAAVVLVGADQAMEAGSVILFISIPLWHDIPPEVAHRDVASPPGAFESEFEAPLDALEAEFNGSVGVAGAGFETSVVTFAVEFGTSALEVDCEGTLGSFEPELEGRTGVCGPELEVT